MHAQILDTEQEQTRGTRRNRHHKENSVFLKDSPLFGDIPLGLVWLVGA
jgi:hypothetical protein